MRPCRPTLSRPPLAEHWDALHQAAAAIAQLAGQALAPELDWDAVSGVAPPWRLDRAERELADLIAVLRAGLTALIAVAARGADPRPAATALLNEYAEARSALGVLLRPIG